MTECNEGGYVIYNSLHDTYLIVEFNTYVKWERHDAEYFFISTEIITSILAESFGVSSPPLSTFNNSIDYGNLYLNMAKSIELIGLEHIWLVPDDDSIDFCLGTVNVLQLLNKYSVVNGNI